MTRPLHIWILFGLSLTILLLATAWVSVAVWRLDEAQLLAQRQGDHEEKIRLALWRMDTFMSPLIVEEAARPFEHFQSFHTPEKAYSKSRQSVHEVMVPSPLLSFASSNVVLHFQMDARGNVTSPQVPEGGEREVAMRQDLNAGRLARAETSLAALKNILGDPMDSSRARTIAWDGTNGPLQNRDFLLLSCGPFRTNVVQLPELFSTQSYAVDSQATQARTIPSQQSQQMEEPRVQLDASSVANWGALKQRFMNSAEQSARANVYQEIVRNDYAYSPLDPLAQLNPWRAREGPIRPLWVGQELLLVRRAMLSDAAFIQGVWLQWNHLRASLLASIEDLFPNADLQAMTTPLGEIDSRMMASIPVKLISPPGLVVNAPLWTPMRISLGVAWICVLIAGAAVAVLLHGVVSLSERRGDFVSAVTHELRTPLTTFKMYSEMLADDMVPEGEKRREYLRTLCAESNRLSHLVENVLSYARLERGAARRNLERLSLGSLIDRAQPPLSHRAEQGGMKLSVEITDDLRGLSVEVDASVVEQILFNLVDNACKYARVVGHDSGGTIHLKARRRGRYAAELVVEDHGQGLAPDALRRLFKPFSKSAQEAASSAPGVGLGLALCRRLSREMGADLYYQGRAGQGACFVIRLPLAEG